MQKMSQTEEMAKMLAGRARRHVLTPEQVSRAMEEQDFDPAGLDELYAALEMRGVQVPRKRQSCRFWTKSRSESSSMSCLPKAWRWTTR